MFQSVWTILQYCLRILLDIQLMHINWWFSLRYIIRNGRYVRMWPTEYTLQSYPFRIQSFRYHSSNVKKHSILLSALPCSIATLGKHTHHQLRMWLWLMVMMSCCESDDLAWPQQWLRGRDSHFVWVTTWLTRKRWMYIVFWRIPYIFLLSLPYFRIVQQVSRTRLQQGMNSSTVMGVLWTYRKTIYW